MTEEDSTLRFTGRVGVSELDRSWTPRTLEATDAAVDEFVGTAETLRVGPGEGVGDEE